MVEKRDFDSWLSKFKKSIATYEYYIDFEKVKRNVDKIKVELNILNSLIGSSEIESEFRNLIKQYPEVLKCIPILLAIRGNQINVKTIEEDYVYNFKKMNYTIDKYVEFMRETGLFDLLSNNIINNIYDYVTGVETGLDSNGRKNRGGHLMEDLVEENIKKLGVKYYKELRTDKLVELFNIDISKITNEGKTIKRFDFVIYYNNIVYAIETNFYQSGGSKLNETARSFKNLALSSKPIPNFEFVWITDGQGWNSARNNLSETFSIMKNIYSLNDLQHNALGKMIDIY